MLTSEQLVEGQVYTREALKQQFGITDQTLFTGIFQPTGHDSIWLFITEHKPADRPQYQELLDGDTLYWQGQTEGRKDQLIKDHNAQRLELLVFYRKAKTEFPGAGFRYEGRFRYMSHSGAHPTNFVLKRVDTLLETVRHDLQAQQAEEGLYPEGKRSLILVNHYERDPQVRAVAIRAHGTRCQACGFSFSAVYGPHGADSIEVHHLRPISSYNGQVQVDPVQDMAVLCANCHRMIHRHPEQPLTLEDLRGLIQQARDATNVVPSSLSFQAE